jgi:S1-C subfamily serine protease
MVAVALSVQPDLDQAIAGRNRQLRDEDQGRWNRKAGDFTAPGAVSAKSASPSATDAPSAGKSSKTVSKTGTGFVISPSGQIITNQHVIAGGTGDIRGNLTGEAVMTLRTASSDESNDLVLLQAPASASFKDFARIRDRTIRLGDSVVAIGFPNHGLLTSDFTGDDRDREFTERHLE